MEIREDRQSNPVVDEVGALVAVTRDLTLSSVLDIQSPVHREVARIYAERRDFPIGDVIEAIRKFAQPELLTTSTETVRDVPFATTAVAATSTIITPIPHASSNSPDVPDAIASPAH
jgi:hypothetical protein